jgi:hypothetical protein
MRLRGVMTLLERQQGGILFRLDVTAAPEDYDRCAMICKHSSRRSVPLGQVA